MEENQTMSEEQVPQEVQLSEELMGPPEGSIEPAVEEVVVQLDFDEDLVTKFPKSNRRIQLGVSEYNLATAEDGEKRGHTCHISPHGIEFQSPGEFPEGALLKIHVNLPNYWNRKQKFVNYRRIDSPNNFKVLAKVLRSEEVGKRGKKKRVLVQTVNIDEVDEQVLRAYLEDG